MKHPNKELHIWDALLRCQADITLPLELPYYYMSRPWLKAGRVLDLGTGNGDYLMKLYRHFPDKQYFGIDHNAEYIQMANERGRGFQCVRFAVQDIFHVKQNFPLVIARLVAQHLPSVESFLRSVKKLLKDNGRFISIEPQDRLRSFQPELPEVMSLFQHFREDRTGKGFDRDAGDSMSKIAHRCGFTIEHSGDIVIPSTIGHHRKLFVQFHNLIFLLFKDVYKISANYKRMASELQEWEKCSTSYAQLGIRFVIYRGQV